MKTTLVQIFFGGGDGGGGKEVHYGKCGNGEFVLITGYRKIIY